MVSTLNVDVAWVSPAVLRDLEGREDVEVLETGLTCFSDEGELLPF